jgi:hypothetical protein
MSAGKKATKCERCGFLPDPSPYSDDTDVLDKDGLCYACARVMSFASFVQACDPEMRWHFLSDLFEAIETFDELDAEKADAAKAAPPSLRAIPNIR